MIVPVPKTAPGAPDAVTETVSPTRATGLQPAVPPSMTVAPLTMVVPPPDKVVLPPLDTVVLAPLDTVVFAPLAMVVFPPLCKPMLVALRTCTFDASI